jgi:hypothetical protein
MEILTLELTEEEHKLFRDAVVHVLNWSRDEQARLVVAKFVPHGVGDVLLENLPMAKEQLQRNVETLEKVAAKLGVV